MSAPLRVIPIRGLAGEAVTFAHYALSGTGVWFVWEGACHLAIERPAKTLLELNK